jgi:signal transduction histidine kinase
MAQTLSEGTAPEEDRPELLGRLVVRANDLARLVQRFEAAVEAGLTEWADVNEVAREVAATNARLHVEATGAPAMASLNRLSACRILEELVENALAFSGEDDVRIEVTTEDGSPVVRVIDRGSGIDADSLPRIFAPLEQGESLNARTHQGIGLGLAIARMSARAMGGDVILEATGPAGSTFTWLVSGDRPDASLT